MEYIYFVHQDDPSKASVARRSFNDDQKYCSEGYPWMSVDQAQRLTTALNKCYVASRKINEVLAEL